MKNVRLFGFAVLSVLFISVSPAFASVVINEVLFDPSGSDTGLEKIELYNPNALAINMSGWELYPDGIGYFMFPSGFSLSAKSLVVIHLRASGANDSSNLYHSSASANMGNSSGSIALFSETGHPSDSIVDFVRYHKPGSSERKTWESAAANAGFWTAGEFINITDFPEGSSVSLVNDGVRGSISAWKVGTATIGGLNNSEASGSGSESTSTPPPPSTSVTPPAPAFSPPQSLKVYAGGDKMVFQGTMVEFRGSADGINGEPLTSGRFLWNFGDGTTKEGRIISHIYYFPGVYNVNLSVSSGEYTGAGYLKITVIRPDLFISEAKSGERGFVELYNNTDYRLDLGGFLMDDGIKSFTIERDTYINSRSVLVFSNAVTGLFFAGQPFYLKDAHNFVVDGGDFSGPLLAGESFEKVSLSSKEFIKTKQATPGVYKPFTEAGRPATEGDTLTATTEISAGGTKSVSDEAAVETTVVKDESIEPTIANDEAAAVVPPKSFSTLWFFVASIFIGISAAVGFVIMRFK